MTNPEDEDPAPPLDALTSWPDKYVAAPSVLCGAIGDTILSTNRDSHLGWALVLVCLSGMVAWCAVLVVQLNRDKRQMVARAAWFERRHGHLLRDDDGGTDG